MVHKGTEDIDRRVGNNAGNKASPAIKQKDKEKTQSDRTANLKQI